MGHVAPILQTIADAGIRSSLYIKSLGFTSFVQAVCFVGLVMKICHMYPLLPLLPGKKKRAEGVILPKGVIIGHRGSCSEGLPENTICAFLDAIQAGVDIIELDVWLTADKKLVVFHDEDFSRMTASLNQKKVNDVLLEDLPDLVPGIYQRSRIAEVIDGTQISTAKAMDATNMNKDALWKRIPTLEQVLAVLPNHIGLIIEVKDPQPEMVPLLHAIVKKQCQARQDNMYWFSLRSGINSALMSFDSKIPCITSLPNIFRVLLFYMVGLAPFINFNCDAFGIDVRAVPMERINKEKALMDAPQWLKEMIGYIFQGSPPTMCMLPKLYNLMRKRGTPVYFLGVETQMQIHSAIENGASGFLTDKPNFACKYMRMNRLKMNTVDF